MSHVSGPGALPRRGPRRPGAPRAPRCSRVWHAGHVTAELCIVVIHYRVPRVLAECLARLQRFVPDAEIVLVDTAPDDDVLAEVHAAHPGIQLVRATNHSLAHAVNIGIKRSRAPFVAFMNADVYVEPSTFDELLAVLASEPQAGIVGPLALTPRGRPQDQGPDYLFHYLRLPRAPGRSVEVPWLAGCLQLVRREVLAHCGGLDPSLRFYNEDIEFCVRARRAGFRSRLVATPVLHLGGSSTPAAAAFMVEGRRGGMQLSRRYYPPWVRRLHRAFLIAEGWLGATFAGDDTMRERYRLQLAMAWQGRFDESPFGATLQDLRPTT